MNSCLFAKAEQEQYPEPVAKVNKNIDKKRENLTPEKAEMIQIQNLKIKNVSVKGAFERSEIYVKIAAQILMVFDLSPSAS